MSDPVAWAKYKADEAVRARERRARRTGKQKDRDKETCRQRQKKLYDKRKNEDMQIGETPLKKINKKVLTRSEKVKQTEYNRIKKRESRAKLTPQQRRRQREKNSKYQREKRAAAKKKKTKKPAIQTSLTREQVGFQSDAARRMALSRIWAKLPTDPAKFADIVDNFLTGSRSTPRKQAALTARGLTTKRHLVFDGLADGLKEKLSILSKKKDKQSLRDRRLLISSVLIRRKYRNQKILARMLDTSENYLVSISKQSEHDLLCPARKKRKDATCLDVVINVQNFYQDAKISRELPCMKSVKKQMPRRVMEVTVERAYSMWKEVNPNSVGVVGFSLFQKLRPDYTLLQHKIKINQCLCEYCTDALLKLQALNRTVVALKKPELKIKDKYELTELTMCPKVTAKYCAPGCINRTCPDCGVALLDKRMLAFKTDHGDTEIQWNKWESRRYEFGGQMKSKKVQLTKRGKLKELLDELSEITVHLAKHIFVSNWQQDMFLTIRTKLPLNWALFVLDFAENYSCLSQDEIQSAHWAIEQVTVHPIVGYYHCQHNDTSHIVQEAMVMISEDLLHDYHAVHHFEKLALKHLINRRGQNLIHLVEFTDGCGAQFKSKGPFADVSFAQDDHCLSLERHFFGSRHGKGPSDGVSGVVKSSVRRAVLARRVLINSAAAMFDYCQKNLVLENCDAQRRSFFFVKQGDINRDRTERVVKSAVQGTRALHSVRSVEAGVIDVRLLGCFCDGCISGNPLSTCSNSIHVLPWQRRALKMTIPPKSTDDNLWKSMGINRK